MSNNLVFELSSLPSYVSRLRNSLSPHAMYPSKQLRNRLNEEPATMDYNTQYMLRSRLKSIKSMAETYGLRYTKTNLRAIIMFPNLCFGDILSIHLCKPDEGKPAFEFELNKCGLWPAQGKMDIELTAVKSEQICNNKYNGEYTVFDINMSKLSQWLGDARMVYELYVVEQHKKDIRSAASDLAEIVGKGGNYWQLETPHYIQPDAFAKINQQILEKLEADPPALKEGREKVQDGWPSISTERETK